MKLRGKLRVIVLALTFLLSTAYAAYPMGGGMANYGANTGNYMNSMWQGATVMGNGWDYMSWFGYFHTSDTAPWIYHAEHGWLYPYGTSTSSMWFWDSQMNAYWWTSEAMYPFMYRSSDGAWLYYEEGTSNPRIFYNYKTSQMEKVGGS